MDNSRVYYKENTDKNGVLWINFMIHMTRLEIGKATAREGVEYSVLHLGLGDNYLVLPQGRPVKEYPSITNIGVRSDKKCKLVRKDGKFDLLDYTGIIELLEAVPMPDPRDIV